MTERWPPAVRRDRWRIAATYTATGVEQGFELLYPLAIGVAIDGLIARQPQQLTLLVAVWLAHIAVGLGRQMYDTRLFTRLYAITVTDMVDRQGGSGVDATTLTGRAALARELIDFFEYDLPSALTTLLATVGTLVLLTALEPAAGGLAVLLLVPVTVLNWRYGRRAAALNGELNNAAERDAAVVATRDRTTAAAHFGLVARLRVRLSDAEARTWSVTDLCSLALVVAVLLVLSRDGTRSAGEIFAVLAYVLALTDAIDTLPFTVERTVQAYDVTRRIRDTDWEAPPER